MVKYTKNQWLILVVFAIADFCSAVCVSLQAPFYPHEAEKKGVRPSEYGLVFGIFELTVFLVSPIYGKYLNVIGPQFMFTAGIFVTANTCVLFGLLGFVTDSTAFVGLSFAVRIIEAMGNAGFITASFSLIAQQFSDNVSSTFACLETFYGMGLIVGPSLGGVLYEVGGYSLPFVSLGCVFFCVAGIAFCILPKNTDSTPNAQAGNLLQAVKVLPIFIASYAIVATAISIGFLQATLEPHLRQLELTPLQLGLMFMVNGGAYALSAPFWGWLSDKKSPRTVTMTGSLIIASAFMLIGPAPFIPIEEISVPLCVTALLLHGIGFGALLVSTFSSAHRDALAYGFPDGLQTYGLISGIWASSFALGAFAGPSAAGVLFDFVGFRWASMLVVVLHLLVAFSVSIYKLHRYRQSRSLYPKVPKDLAVNRGEILPLFTDYDSSYCSDSNHSSLSESLY